MPEPPDIFAAIVSLNGGCEVGPLLASDNGRRIYSYNETCATSFRGCGLFIPKFGFDSLREH